MKTLQTLISPFISPLRRFLRDEHGATAIEYALIAAGISAAIIGSVTALGTKVSTMWGTISSSLN